MDYRMNTACCWRGTMRKEYWFNDPYDNNGDDRISDRAGV